MFFEDPHPIANQLKNAGNTIVTIDYRQADEGPLNGIDLGSNGYNFNNSDPKLVEKLLNAFCDSKSASFYMKKMKDP